MAKPQDTYFDQAGKLAKRQAELKAFYEQTTMIDPLLKVLEAQQAMLERGAVATERIAALFELYLGSSGIGTQQTEQNTEVPSATYTDETEDWAREKLEELGRIVPVPQVDEEE